MSAALALDPNEVAKKCCSSPHSSGVEATFFPIDEKWGIKYWLDSDLRDMNYKYQNHASKHGLAPSVGRNIDFTHPRSDKIVYGFFTEICPNILSLNPEYNRISPFFASYKQDDDYNMDFDHYNLPNLKKQLKDIGFVDVCDLHNANVGFMDDGRFVCIDFGQMLLQGE